MKIFEPSNVYVWPKEVNDVMVSFRYHVETRSVHTSTLLVPVPSVVDTLPLITLILLMSFDHSFLLRSSPLLLRTEGPRAFINRIDKHAGVGLSFSTRVILSMQPSDDGPVVVLTIMESKYPEDRSVSRCP